MTDTTGPKTSSVMSGSFSSDGITTVAGYQYPGPDGTWLVTSRTADAVRLTAQEAGVRVSEVSAEPGHPLERFADLVSLTDFAATYLALASGLDPLTSPHVADLRDRTR